MAIPSGSRPERELSITQRTFAHSTALGIGGRSRWSLTWIAPPKQRGDARMQSRKFSWALTYEDHATNRNRNPGQHTVGRRAAIEPAASRRLRLPRLARQSAPAAS